MQQRDVVLCKTVMLFRRVNVVRKNFPTQEKINRYQRAKYITAEQVVEKVNVFIPVNKDDRSIEFFSGGGVFRTEFRNIF